MQEECGKEKQNWSPGLSWVPPQDTGNIVSFWCCLEVKVQSRCLETPDYLDLMFGLNGGKKCLFGVGARKTRVHGLTARVHKPKPFRNDYFNHCEILLHKFVRHFNSYHWRKCSLKLLLSFRWEKLSILLFYLCLLRISSLSLLQNLTNTW